MSDFDNTIVLYDEDGDEIEFDIVHRVPYKGETYLVLWADETDDMAVVVERNGGYEVVDDDDTLDYVKASFAEGMADLKFEIDSLSDKLEDMDELISSALEDTENLLEEAIPTAVDEDDSELESSASPVEFDYTKYILQSQDFLFKDAQSKYAASKFEEALLAYIEADNDGNVFAAAHIGMMYHYGEGCIKDEEKAFKYFAKGAQNGCPLATAWKAECYRMGYYVEKNKSLANKMYSADESALKEMCKAGDTAALYFLGFNLIMGIGCDEDEAEGVRMLETAVYQGDARSAVQLAECYMNGWGVSKDEGRVADLLQNNPANGHKKYHYLLGRCYYNGAGFDQDYNKAFSEFEKAAKLGLGKAKGYLGDCYYYGQGVEKDLYEAARWYKDAADNNGIGSAAHSLAFMYANGEGLPKNREKAVDYFLIAAEKGIVQAQRIIATEYVSGDILPKDFQKAKFWMEEAAKQGDPQAQLQLGRYYVSDFGFKDDKMAYEWFEKAALQGDAEAQYTVRGCYIYEIYVKHDPSVANNWSIKAAEQGHARAKYELGMSYLNGRGFVKNTDKGIEYLISAADSNDNKACTELADRFYLGEGTHKDLVKAKEYAIRAAVDERNESAQYRLATILQELGESSESEAWYRKAIMNGNRKAMLALSKIYIQNGTNYFDAVSMLDTLSMANIGEAQYMLAYCTENGLGCQKDRTTAKQLYKLAVANGFKGEPFPKKKRFGLF